MPTHTVDLQRLYAAVDAKRIEQGKSWRQLARELDLAPSRFTHLAAGARTSADTFLTLLQWLEADASHFTAEVEPGSRRRGPTDAPADPRRSLGARLERHLRG